MCCAGLARMRLRVNMLDGEGFVAGLAAAGHSVAGRRICIVGAGGAASATSVALAERGPARLMLINRSRERLLALHERDVGGHDLVVNATSLGLRADDPLPFGPERVGPGVLVAEVIMSPEMTPILHAAAGRGRRSIRDGPCWMASWRRFFGIFPQTGGSAAGRCDRSAPWVGRTGWGVRNCRTGRRAVSGPAGRGWWRCGFRRRAGLRSWRPPSRARR